MRTPQAIFILLAVLVGIAAYLTGDSTIELPLFDFYFVIKREHLALALVIPFILISLIYFSFKRIHLIRWMTWFHVFATAIPLFIIPFINRLPLSILFSTATLIFAVLFVLGQIVFWINLFLSYRRRND